jgi:hypothetical protein
MPVPSTFSAARSTLVSLRTTTAGALYARTVAQQNLDAALRSGDSGAITTAQNALTGANMALGDARSAEAGGRGTLNGLINDWLTIPNSNPKQPLAIDNDLARLDVAGVPIALFPVRLETRFDLTTDPTKPVLHIRIYPDEFFSDIHERELTPDESAAGHDYWFAVQNNNNVETSAFWAPIAKRYGVPRAAYIVNVTDPSVEHVSPSPRATVPSRGAEAVLPDRWVALAYKGGVLRHTQAGLPIPEPIDLTANPSADDQTLVPVVNGVNFNVPSNILWTVQYQEAFNNGMAIDIGNLSADEVQGGFDRIVVVGVKTSMDPLSASQMLSRLFDAHHYTRGLDLVPLGTPTNNVPGQPTPFTMKDPPAERSFQIERLGPDFSNEGAGSFDFGVLSEMFGFDFENGPFTFLRGAVDSQQDIATGQNMRFVIWPATLGYFMKQMMNPGASLSTSLTARIFTDGVIQNAKDFFTNNVSAQGPAPAFRVGAVPYGLLPAISYSRMKAQAGENSDAMEVIRKLVPVWQQAVASIPVVPQNSTDRNTDLMTVLSQKSSSDGVYVRNSIGPDTITNLYQLLLQDLAAYFTALAQVPSATLGAIGHGDWSAARIFDLMFSASISQYAGPLVTAHPDQGMLVSAVNPMFDPNDPTTFNYLYYLAYGSLPYTTVQDQGGMTNAAPAGELTPLLYLIARHSLLLEIIAAARSSSSTVLTPVFNPQNQPKILEIDFELWGIVTTAGQADLTSILTTQPSGGGGKSVFQLIQSEGFDSQGKAFDPDGRYGAISFALRQLSSLSVDELTRVFTETLDLAAHRLDAYVTALGTRRLRKFRDDANNQVANQTYFGGYGIVENVRPVTRTTRTVNGVTYDVQLDNGGYIHAPSPRHATAAAILRSGRMAEQHDPTKYAIELPSDRARRARLLVDGVRNGQTLGELLGFELESGLRASGAPQPEAIILALRKLYPLVGNKSGLDPGQPADGIAAANVVDGQLVRQAAASPAGIPFGTTGPLAAGKTFILAQVKVLNDIVDSVADLEMSEAIFQVAAGDVASAEAAMNFLPNGSNPPESEVTSSPTTGIPVSHRVALLMEGTGLPGAPGWTLVSTPQTPTPSLSLRGQVDSFAEAWVGSLLGDPSNATATVAFQKGGNPGTDHVSVAKMTTIGPLDFLALAQSTSASAQGSPLDRQLAAAWLALPGNGTAIDVVVSGYDTPTSGPSIPQLIELARALGAVLGGACELAAADFVLTPDDVNDPSLDPSVVSGQATAAINALSTLVQSFDGGDPRTVLATASLYQAEAFPDPSGTDGDLAVQVMNAKGELRRRVTDAQAAAVGDSASNADKIAAAINQLRSIFGRNTLVVLPSALPPGSGELQQSLVALDQPLDLTNPNLNLSDPNTFAPHQAPGRYLQQASRVHERLGAWRRFALYAGGLLGAPSPRVSVAQLPFVDQEQWVGRVAPTESRTSMLFISANGQTKHPDATQVWRGLLLDQWTEVVPAASAQTGLAFHYDSQNSEAPQVILMAIQSGLTANWNIAELSAIVNETLDLAQIRPVDNDKVQLGQLVPPICLASNLQNYVVSTHIDKNSRQDVPIVVG